MIKTFYFLVARFAYYLTKIDCNLKQKTLDEKFDLKEVVNIIIC